MQQIAAYGNKRDTAVTSHAWPKQHIQRQRKQTKSYYLLCDDREEVELEWFKALLDCISDGNVDAISGHVIEILCGMLEDDALVSEAKVEALLGCLAGADGDNGGGGSGGAANGSGGSAGDGSGGGAAASPAAAVAREVLRRREREVQPTLQRLLTRYLTAPLARSALKDQSYAIIAQVRALIGCLRVWGCFVCVCVCMCL